MPSDELARGALEILAGPRARFEETLTLSIEEIRGFLRSHRDPDEDQGERVAHELGAFAQGRIDMDRFAALLQDSQSLDREVKHELEVALETLTRLRDRGDDLFLARVAPGGDLRDTVARALSEVGSALAAARLVEAAQSGGGQEERDASQKGFPFRRWSRDERGVAPPLVVQVEGGDLVAGGLDEFLDGSVKLVLVVTGKAPAAALAGLIAPGVWVEQTDSADKLADFAGGDVPGIAAVVPEGCAVFRFRGDLTDGDRLEVESVPEGAPRARIGSISAAQQVRALALLEALASGFGGSAGDSAGTEVGLAEVAAPPAGSGVSETPPPVAQPLTPAADPAGALAGWLLQNADLSGN
jgi:hypothetical protein